MSTEANIDDCGRPTCICHRGYQAVQEYEKANGIEVKTIELSYEDLLRLKEETGSWFIANRMLVKQHYLDEGKQVFADAIQKEIDNYLTSQESNS